MSLSNKNYQKSTESDNITKWEIQPYVPNPVLEGFFRKDALSQLVEVLREMVAKATSELKQRSAGQTRQRATDGVLVAIPISYNVPDDCDINTIRMNMAPLQKRKRTSTSFAGEISVSFKFPEDCDIDATEVDKSISLPVHQFSFSERLDGWKIERRQRSNGRYDLYYHHEKARRTFRSTIEVVDFLLYEAYPDKPRQPSKGQSKSEYRRRVLKRKWTSSTFESSCKSKDKMCFSSDACEGYMTETVEEILDVAYKNFLNSAKSRMHSGSEPEECTGFSSDSEEEVITREMVEEFLDAAHKHLLNYFNEEENVPEGTRSQRVEEPKEEGQSRVAPAQDSISANPIQETKGTMRGIVEEPKEGVQTTVVPSPDSISANPIHEYAKPVELQTNPVQVNDPAEVEGNTGTSSSSLSAYNEQCDLINHIPQVSESELLFFLANSRPKK